VIVNNRNIITIHLSSRAYYYNRIDNRHMLLNGVAVVEDDYKSRCYKIVKYNIIIHKCYHKSVFVLRILRGRMSLVSDSWLRILRYCMSAPIIFSSLEFSNYNFVFVFSKPLSHPKSRNETYLRFNILTIFTRRLTKHAFEVWNSLRAVAGRMVTIKL